MSCINLLANDIWSEADIVAHGRAVIDAQCSPVRQSELQTIMLGHISGMRLALANELQEIGKVQFITEKQAADNDQARADMARLLVVMDYELNPDGKTLTQDEQAIYDLRHPQVVP